MLITIVAPPPVQAMAAKVDPNLGAPAQRICWLANRDGSKYYDDDEGCSTQSSFNPFFSAFRQHWAGAPKLQ